MSAVVADMTMSLDGFVADASDGVGELFGWYGNGDVVVQTPDPERTFRTSTASAAHLRRSFDRAGAVICGRRLFDLTGGWGGTSPAGAPVFVVTHTVPQGWPRHDAPFSFVTDGIGSAVASAKATAGPKDVVIATADIARQRFELDLIDEVTVNLVPVMLGAGIRFFDVLPSVVRFDGPDVVEGTGVTHLTYRVRAPGPA